MSTREPPGDRIRLAEGSEHDELGLNLHFCGREPREVISVVNAISVNAKGRQTAAAICNECVELCVQVIGLQKPEWLERHRQFVATLGE